MIDGKRVIEDGKQRLELHACDFSSHVDEFVLPYLASHKRIVTGDQVYVLRDEPPGPAGQRELNDPNVQQRIRETLMNRKDQLLRSAYYEVARNEAKVENFFAQSVVQSRTGKK